MTVYSNLFICRDREPPCSASVESILLGDGDRARLQHGDNPEHSREFNVAPVGLIHWRDDTGVEAFDWLESLHERSRA